MDNNAYQAPKADLELSHEPTTQDFQYFNLNGRIGRLRYLQLAYLLPTIVFFGYAFLVILLMNLSVRNPITDPPGFDYIQILTWGLPIILIVGAFNGVWLSVQRAHDMGYSAWLAIVAVVPLIGIVLLVMPGDLNANKFGLAPKENSMLVKITGWLGIVGVAFYYLLIAILVTEGF